MPGKQAKLLTTSMVRAVMTHVRKKRYPVRDLTMILLSVKVGLRAGEIANLTWGMVLDARCKVRQLNDQFRKTLVGGRIVLTCGVREKGEEAVKQLLALLCAYDDFTEDNDPYSEHDFGQIEFQGTKYFFNIDYYDMRMLMHSPDAADPKVTCRVLTIMLASEY